MRLEQSTISLSPSFGESGRRPREVDWFKLASTGGGQPPPKKYLIKQIDRQ
jgi:hypothetical protein